MSVDTLRSEHESMQAAVRASRRTLEPSMSVFVREMQKVMDEYRDARVAGLTREQAIPGIESALRQVWGKPTTKFGPACDACEDTGWTEHTCYAEARTCGRDSCHAKPSSFEHLYVTPCHCPRGDGPGHRTRVAQLDEIGEAMKTRKPKSRGFSRM